MQSVLIKRTLVPILHWVSTAPWRYMVECSWRRHHLEVSGQSHSPAALPSAERQWYLLDKGPNEPQNPSGRYIEKKNLSYKDSNSDPSAVQPVGSRYSYCAIADPICILSCIHRNRACFKCTLKAPKLRCDFTCSLLWSNQFHAFVTQRAQRRANGTWRGGG
jgi:hypothetical protein